MSAAEEVSRTLRALRMKCLFVFVALLSNVHGLSLLGEPAGDEGGKLERWAGGAKGEEIEIYAASPSRRSRLGMIVS